VHGTIYAIKDSTRFALVSSPVSVRSRIHNLIRRATKVAEYLTYSVTEKMTEIKTSSY